MDATIFINYRDWLTHQKMPEGKRAALLSATELFATKGFEETSTSEIATAAGISQATIFKYFHTKQALLMAVVRPVMEHFFPVYANQFFKQLTACTTLTTMVHFMVTDRYQFIIDNIEPVKIMAREMMTSPEIRQLFGQLVATHDFNFLRELLCNFRRTGELRDDIDAAAILRIIAGQILVYLIQTTYAPVLVNDEKRDMQLITDQIVRALTK